MRINLIAAVSRNGGIGINNKLPWEYLCDMKYFFKQTTHLNKKKRENGRYSNALLMGSNTFNSFDTPLPYRDHFILSKKHHSPRNFTTNYGVYCMYVNNLYTCIQNCKGDGYETLWCIGGSQIYKHALDRIIFDEVHITYIDRNYDCDAFFPELPKEYKLHDKVSTKEKNTNILFQTYRPI